MARLPLADAVARIERPLRESNDLDRLLDEIGDRRIVLLGEASHGTSEYYEWRRRISERLIREKEFSFIAVEGDWPDCYALNRYAKALPEAGRSAHVAGDEWDAPMRSMRVPEASRSSWEAVLHEAGARDKLLFMYDLADDEDAARTRGHRAIGVVYDPDWERAGNYVPTRLTDRYDALIYIDESHALHRLHMPSRDDGEPPETYPTGM